MVAPDPPASPPPTSGPPTLQPPRGAGGPDGGDSGHRLIWFGLSVLLLLGLAVVVVLPRIGSWSDETDRAADEAMVDPLIDEQDPVSTAELEGGGLADRTAARADAEQTLQDYLKRRARLELAGAAVWGEPQWTRAADHAVEADRLFGYQRFRPAADGYASATKILAELEASREDRLAAALSGAEAALDENRALEAREGFELVLAIEAEHAAGRAGLARARVRDEVVALVRQADRAERIGDLDGAREAYAKAVALDAGYGPAADGLGRVTAAVLERGFREAMTRALADIDARRFAAATAGLDAASRLRADDPAVADARRRLAAARQRAELERLRKQAARGERAENWADAVAIYEKALELAPSAGFALEGIEHARERARLNEQVGYYLDDPERLYSPDPLAHAERLIASAGAIPAGEPKLEAKLEELQRDVRRARRPLLVTVRSDGETEVAIYHVARLGRFEERSLELRPGTYTIVGSRPGYRDVRRVIDVKPGSAPVPVAIRCEERI